MPVTFESTRGQVDLSRTDVKSYHAYYPFKRDLKPGSTLHSKIIEEVLKRAKDSERFMTPRHTKWTEINRMLTAFIEWDESEKSAKSRDPRKPVSIVVPESAAQLDVILSYMLATFGESPVFRYMPVEPGDALGCTMLEMHIENQVRRSKMLLPLYTNWRDAFSLGFGVIAVDWKVEYGTRTRWVPYGDYDYNGNFVPLGTKRSKVDVLQYEGGSLTAVDPARYLPDPSRNITKVQEGNFVGWVVNNVDYYELLEQEEVEEGFLFNVRWLEGSSGTSSVYSGVDVGRHDATSVTAQASASSYTNTHDVLYFYWRIIPKELGVGNSTRPEIWLFAIADDSIVIAAHPIELDHRKFPVAVCAPDFDEHALLPVSRLEMIQGLAEVINFYLNSHVMTARQALNHILFVDPRIVNMRDVMNREAGGMIIRVRPAFWGRGTTDGITQLKVTDVTGNHMTDLALARDLARNESGAVDSLHGIQRTRGERVTAKEFTDTRAAALSRLRKAATIVSLQSMHDIGRMLASHTQQFMSEDTSLRVLGQWEERLRLEHGITDPYLSVSPFDIDVMYDVDIADSSVEASDNADLWINLYQMLIANPEVAMGIDSVRVFLHIARLLGSKSAYDFVRKGPPVQANTMPDEQVAELADKGRLKNVATT